MRGPITSVRIPFGLLGGRMVSPAEVVSGLACGCVCPGCGAALVARKGSIAWCFAHHAKTGSESCSESAIHAVGKQVILDANALVVPAYVIEASGPTVDGEIHYSHRVLGVARRIRFDHAIGEVSEGGLRIDVVGYKGQRRLLLEIFVTHRVDADKLRKLQELGAPALEIDLSDMPRMGAGLVLEEVRKRVIDGNSHKNWLVFPGEQAARIELEQQLKTEIDAKNKKILREEEASRRRTSELERIRIANHSAYRALPDEEKERQWRKTLQIGDGWPDYIAPSTFDTPGLETPTRLWQALLFQNFVARRKGIKEGFTIDHVVTWAREWIGVKRAPGRDPIGVLRRYVAFLEARNYLAKSPFRPNESTVRYIVPADPQTKISAVVRAKAAEIKSVGAGGRAMVQSAEHRWQWNEKWPRRAVLYEEIHTQLQGSEHQAALSEAVDALGPLDRPETPDEFGHQLVAQGVPHIFTMETLKRLDLIVPHTKRYRPT